MILSAQDIRVRCVQNVQTHIYPSDWRPMIEPFFERAVVGGMSYGLSSAGYDIRLAQAVEFRGADFKLASSVEEFHMPNDVLAQVCDKSTWARRGLTVQNTIIEPGWSGFLTLELINHLPRTLFIPVGYPIAQIIFMRLTRPTEQPYRGKYQYQESGPQVARMEK